MFILDRRSFLAASGAALIAQPARAATSTQVFTAGAESASVDSVVVMGEDSAVLIDAQLNIPSAAALADRIAATGRRLETIFITHHHPDHVLGLAVLTDRFPAARVLAHPKIRAKIEATAESYLAFFRSQALGAFAERVVIPEALTADHILLEGERLEILDPMPGDTDLISAVHIPALDTLVASDFAYADMHVWLAEVTTPERIEAWRASLSALEGVGAGAVIPGHQAEGSAHDATVFAKTRAYLAQWQGALATASDGAELKAAMLAGNEELGFALALDRAVGTVYPAG